MSLKKVEQVKKTKWFRPWDLLVYGLLAAIIVALVLVFTLSQKGGKFDGIIISYKGEKVFSYTFSGDTYEIFSEENIEIKENGGEKLLLTFYTDGKEGYNDIEISKSGSVKVSASDCSLHKDCVYTPPLTSSRKTPIICTPHALVISPLTISDDGVIKTRLPADVPVKLRNTA